MEPRFRKIARNLFNKYNHQMQSVVGILIIIIFELIKFDS